MIALIQRASGAKVLIDEQCVAEIDQGLLVLLGIEKDDTQAQADRLLERVLGYRIFADETGKMNLSVKEVRGGVLLVPQFTLPADTQKGMRPSFTPAASQQLGEMLFDYFVAETQRTYSKVAVGVFGADMQVSLTNDGPVTFWLQVKTDDRVSS